MLEAARRYARLGYRVFPCVPGEKRPAVAGGCRAATTDEATIREWWSWHPQANIAISTDGLLVVDVDVSENESANPWLSGDGVTVLESASAPVAKTPRGGTHLYFRQPEGADVRSSAGRVAPRVDVRANGGYVLVEPSVVHGRAYRFEEGRGLVVPPAELPIALAALMTAATTKVQRGGTSPCSNRRRIPEGRRNSTLTSIAGKYRAGGMNEAEILAALTTVNHNRCVPPLPDAEVARIATSMASYPIGPGRWRPGTPRLVPHILVTTHEGRVADEVAIELAKDPDLFLHAGRLARVRNAGVQSAAAAVSIAPLTKAELRDLVTRRVELVAEGKHGPRPEHPRPWLVNALDDRRDWPGIRELVGVTDVPFFRPDGTLCAADGYDPQSGIVVRKFASFDAIPELPTPADAAACATELLDLVEDFPFASSSARAAYVGALLTVMCRSIIEGPAPMFLIDANTRGSGKTLLCNVIGVIATGEPSAVMGYSQSPEELRKTVTSALLTGRRILLMDNVSRGLGCATLDRLITARVWNDRLLGTNRTVDIPVRCVVLATGNNTCLRADTARRVVPIRLESAYERPEQRGEFAVPDIVAHTRAHRERLASCVLTIIRAWVVAGRPQRHLPHFGGFEEWSNSVRQAVVFAGLEDPLKEASATTESGDDLDTEFGQVLRGIVSVAQFERGFTIPELLAMAFGCQGADLPATAAAVRQSVQTWLGLSMEATPGRRQLGNAFRGVRGRVVDGLRLVADGKTASGTRWRVERVS